MPNDKKHTIIQQSIVIGLLAILVWDIFFNKSAFSVSHLGLSVILIIAIFDKFKPDSLNVKVPGILEIAESNKKINENIEKIVNKIQIDAKANASAASGPTNIYIGGDPVFYDKPAGSTYIKGDINQVEKSI